LNDLIKRNDLFKARSWLHFSVLLFGFTAIIGKLLDLNTFVLVWWRMLFSVLFFLIYFFFNQQYYKPCNQKTNLRLMLIGFIIAIHWYCFYGSVKLSHASVALMCMALTTFFTSILNPLINKTKFSNFDFGLSLTIIPLMYFLVDGIKNFNLLGFIVGIGGAFFASLFSTLNKSLVDEDIDERWLSFIEFIGVLIFTTPMAIYYFYQNGFAAHSPFDAKNLMLILVLSFLCTNVAFLTSIFSLKKLAVFETNLIVSLEPVYGIVLAYFVLNEGEFLGFSFYLTSILILLVVFLHPIIKTKFNLK
jgi:drug/metabolite transporter (DMT)-like permease